MRRTSLGSFPAVRAARPACARAAGRRGAGTRPGGRLGLGGGAEAQPDLTDASEKTVALRPREGCLRLGSRARRPCPCPCPCPWPGALRSDAGPHVPGRAPPAGREGWGAGRAEPELRAEPLPGRGRWAAAQPRTAPWSAPCRLRARLRFPRRSGRSSRAPRAPARAAAAALPAAATCLRRAGTDAAPAQGPHAAPAADVIPGATPRGTAWGLLLGQARRRDRLGRCPWPSWQKVPLVSKSCWISARTRSSR